MRPANGYLRWAKTVSSTALLPTIRYPEVRRRGDNAPSRPAEPQRGVCHKMGRITIRVAGLARRTSTESVIRRAILTP
jgi:hypothetical protein